jgi:hypothetical protein
VKCTNLYSGEFYGLKQPLRLFHYKRMSVSADKGVDKDFVVVDTALFICTRLLNIALLVG